MGSPLWLIDPFHWRYAQFPITIAVMNKLSGLVLDRYDDVDGALLRFLDISYFPLIEGHTKTARVFSHEELGRLPDETFAVIIHDGDVTMKKFSMADSGNTGLSVAFFLNTGHLLPVEAQKVAAMNLVRGCGWYDIPVPEELQKIALGLNTLVGATMIPGAVRESKNNVAASRGTGGAILTPAQIKAQRLQMGV